MSSQPSTLALPVLALTEQVVLPGMVVPVELDDTAQAAVDAARAAGDERLLLTPRLPDRHAAVGVIADIEQIGRLPGGARGAVVRATQRARIGAGTTGPGAALWVEVAPVEPHEPNGRERELAAEYKTVVVSVLQRRNAWQIIDNVQSMTDPSAIADMSGYASYLSDERKRELLETVDVAERLTKALAWTREHLAELDVAERIRDDVREGMDKTQREFLLRQQLAAIRKELGEGEASGPGGADDYRTRVEAANLPETVLTAALREVDRLERSSDQSPETGWIRTWLDTVLELPWSTRTPLPGQAAPSLQGAREILDADHEGLVDVKDRIVEYLAVRARRAERGLEVVGGRGSGAVLALIGPPGVGKTSMGESVARALGRDFVRVALGGVRDEAEIRGHRRTYVGALPGRIVRAIKEAGSMNPVVLLDEIDKVGSDFRGDPAAALLEVLDPAQNHTFRDHYLDLDLDLSDVVFLATANVADTIPGPLLDRMELVSLDGYTETEKTAIARRHLLPRQLQRAALTADDVVVTDEVLTQLAAEYTREAGVRQLERAIAKILRKAATRLGNGTPAPVLVDTDTLADFLGRPRFTPESAERTAVPGVATGLAVTGAGGDVLFIEAVVPTVADSNGGLSLTGQLGDVMKESAHIAVSYLKAHGEQLAGVSAEDVARLGNGVHLHVPAGAVPKDGPSAGVTMVTALSSLITGRPVRSDVAMTGEVTLNGRVLPIGGVKQKLLAAHRAGLTTIFLPARNGPDLDDVPADVLEQLEVHLVADVAEIVARALEPAAVQPAAVEPAAVEQTVAAA